MGLRRVALAFCLVVATWFATEGRAVAAPCITGNACSGTTPTCDILSFSCRACGSDLDCGGPLSGDVCVTEGPQKGSCTNAGNAGPRNCSQDSECDAIGGYVCSGVTCVLGCKVTVFGDTCLVGAHCILPINLGLSIGNCSPGGGGSRDASTGGCVTDGDCDLSTGRVCVQGPSGNACEPSCHSTAAGDTCPAPTTCSVAGGGLGVCRQPTSDGGPTACKKDADCSAPGLVCFADECVIGCHETSAGDTCPSTTMCSVTGGGLGTCVGAGTDAGVTVCTTDAMCSPGLVCETNQCVVGCRVTDGGDSCPNGAMCSAITGGVGLCTGGSPSSDGGSSMSCTTDADCNGGLVCEGSQCVVGCRDTDAGTDTCLLGTGGSCSVADAASLGQCVGSDGGVTPSCTLDSDCAHGLVCDSSQCVVGCHDTTTRGDTCDAGSACSVVGGRLGVCVGSGTGPDGGSIGCTQDPDCPQGQVCDQSVCVVGCHAIGTVDTCSAPARCDAVGGSLGACFGGGGDDGGLDGGSLDGAGEPGDATARDGSADGSLGGEPTFEGGGCGCSSAPALPAEGGGLVFLIGLTVLARRRVSK
jgi:hypothetical protein